MEVSLKLAKFSARILLMIVIFVLTACQSQARALSLDQTATMPVHIAPTVSPTSTAPQSTQTPTHTPTSQPTSVPTLNLPEERSTPSPSSTVAAIQVDGLLLRIVDLNHRVDQDFMYSQVIPNLVNFHNRWSLNHTGSKINRTDVLINKLCVDDLIALLDDADKSGVNLYVRSIYRSLESQQIALDNVKGDRSLVLPPGTSQHHTGLAVDFTYGSSAREVGGGFSNTPESAWLQQNALKYGFVMSYVAGHDGVSYETWHYYYIGKELAPIYERLINQGIVKDVFEFQDLINNTTDPAP